MIASVLRCLEHVEKVIARSSRFIENDAVEDPEERRAISKSMRYIYNH